jgi:cobalt-zinc-cadmium efflux system membrane fusion protein
MGARALASLALATLLAACHESQVAPRPSGPAVPTGEIWLTPRQVAEADIVVEPAGPRALEDAVVTSGVVTLDDERTAHVVSPVTGRVVAAPAGLGARVKKGQALAIIHSPDVAMAVADEKKAQADFIFADHDRARKKRLFADGAISAGDYEASQDSYRKALAELQRARTKLELFGSGSYDAVHQVFTLRSPIDGEVLARNIAAGMEVQGQYTGGAQTPLSAVGGSDLFTIGGLEEVWIVADVYEAEFDRVRAGSPMTATLVAYPARTFNGTVDWIAGAFDPSTRTAKVRARFENPHGLLRPNMYATIELSADAGRALAVRRSAVLGLAGFNSSAPARRTAT